MSVAIRRANQPYSSNAGSAARGDSRLGAAAGTTGAFITGKKDVRLPAETRVVFSLRNPVDVRG